MDEWLLLFVLAHPDGESLGVGGILAAYAAGGAVTYLVTATRGERGWPGDLREHPAPEVLGVLREAELRAAAVLRELEAALVGCPDGDVDRIDRAEAIAAFVERVRRVRTQAVVTCLPDGITGHPDHTAVTRVATAVVVFADPGDGRACPTRRPSSATRSRRTDPFPPCSPSVIRRCASTARRAARRGGRSPPAST